MPLSRNFFDGARRRGGCLHLTKVMVCFGEGTVPALGWNSGVPRESERLILMESTFPAITRLETRR
jgi:hypothetical protein